MKVSARDWSFELNTGTEAIPAWTEIGGLNTFEISREHEETDTTDFASAGAAEHEVMQRGRSIKVEGFFLENADSTRDAGQQAVEDLADAVGAASRKQLRVSSPNGKTFTQKVSAAIEPVGGGNNDKTSWGATFKRSGTTTVV
jgi:hypothetical protein